MSNLVTLCRFHHRKVHEGQVVVQVLDDGAIRFVQPDGECFETASRTFGDWQQLPAVHERAGIHIDVKTAAIRGRGGPMDYGLAMDALTWLRRHVFSGKLIHDYPHMSYALTAASTNPV